MIDNRGSLEYDKEGGVKRVLSYVLNIFLSELKAQGEILKKLMAMTLLCGFLQNAGEALFVRAT